MNEEKEKLIETIKKLQEENYSLRVSNDYLQETVNELCSKFAKISDIIRR